MESTVQGIPSFPAPTNVKEWQRFHGIENFYRHHIPRYADLMKPNTSIMGLADKALASAEEFPIEARKLLAAVSKRKDECLSVAIEEAKTAIAQASALLALDPLAWFT